MTADTGLRGLDLLDAAIARADARPETLIPEYYRCGAGMCLAGHIGEAAGGTWAAPPKGYAGECMVAEDGDSPREIDDPRHAAVAVGGHGPMIHVSRRARRLLGFSPYMAEALGDRDDHRDLFSARNTLDDIIAMRDDLRAAGVGR
jgi:hypothetical protein